MESDQAKHEATVKSIYQDEEVAEKYIDDRFKWSWSRLLHEKQVSLLNQVVAERGITTALELAPGPARLTTEVRGINDGLLIEASEEMVHVANRRLREQNLHTRWRIQVGNAFDLSDVSQKFNLVYTFRFIRHFDLAERRRLYFEISSCLEQNGVLVFDVVNKCTRDKIDARESKNAAADPNKLAVFDITYDESEFHREMEQNGFAVIEMIPVIRHFFLQAWTSYKLDRRLPSIADNIVRAVEAIPTNAPLEWIAICQKR